ncbi:hypothetical protein WJX81_003496 [Elliptochloris bilobata]|uniref:Uncharacterized protein n=1 Tax=Elliptochloris bilobata TaxID=381761 RepID=A0AAW1QM05_9CHLO
MKIERQIRTYVCNANSIERDEHTSEVEGDGAVTMEENFSVEQTSAISTDQPSGTSLVIPDDVFSQILALLCADVLPAKQ